MDIYRKLYLIRKSEEEIRRLYPENEMKTPMHMSMGEEAIVVGVCHALSHDDQVFGTYRSHALYLAKTENTDNFFAEMCGKVSSMQKGKSGSMHLCDPNRGFMGASAIVASHISVAVGAAFANLRLKNKKMVAVFFGDGAIEEGTFWESLNLACLMKIPVLFVCEDNGLAVHTSESERHGYDSITDIVGKFKCNVLKEESTDAETIYKLVLKAIKLNEENQMPCFLHLKYYRYLEHVGINEDFNIGYRSKNEYIDWAKRDPIKLQKSKLLALGYGKELEIIELQIDKKIEKSIFLAKKAPFADESELYKDIFSDNEAVI